MLESSDKFVELTRSDPTVFQFQRLMPVHQNSLINTQLTH